jgi:2-amino-4-hydroxy-6-hydroxymethyldihydropteridine diphosphokinase
MTRVYLALGSNVGDRAKNLREAVRLISDAGVRILRRSSVYETEPLGYLDQDWFLNSVVQGETELSAVELLRRLRAIEEQMGSKKAFANGPRLIDLDILLYGDETISQNELQVPHPRMLQRRFVLVPLAEIAPQLQHPGWSGTALEMLAQTTDRSAVRKVDAG